MGRGTKLIKGLTSLVLALLMTSVKASNMHKEAEMVAYELSQRLSLELRDKVFQGKVFEQPISAWQLRSDAAFSNLLQALAKQSIFQQYHSIGNLIMLSGEFAQYAVLLQIERIHGDAYQGILSVMPSAQTGFTTEQSEELYQHLLSEFKGGAKQRFSWVPDSALLLMNIQGDKQRSQHIYFETMEPAAFKNTIKNNLLSAGWKAGSTADFGLSLWTKQRQQVRLYFSAQAEGTALYVLSDDLSKDSYEITD
ncbi:hypothetical protein AAEX37_01260 [Oligella sp. MSHR50489EDL]|uniref:hypothetical protein n=1 Tax=Oligella sp. MSHR50489EDL TaxID=3139409 RepID=UPI003D81A47D